MGGKLPLAAEFPNRKRVRVDSQSDAVYIDLSQGVIENVTVQIPPMHFLFIACKIILDKVVGYKSVCRLHLTSCLNSALWLVYMRVLSIARHEQIPHRERFFKVPQNAM